ncbi:peroxiredoxin [Legionella impletisoli]|uniref:thioredoxin-dependent peroxiredoxin n=1 Tax=Legionella impletisoli TaxID=343510 RepID=A0A917JSR4_9GAMM|nr:peroxiredoxin [Legionella impletisoli]GGI84624.1 peroxiredoxin [Legionella impletisoli]
MNLGEKIPSTEFVATNNVQSNFDAYRGKWLVLYFYPKDSTPGCTLESQEFRDQYSKFKKKNAEILGVSRDSLKSHEKFKAKYELPFELISDPDETLCQAFEVIKMKSMYGKQVRGIERSTFLIDPDGVLRHEWRKVSVKGHVEEVLSKLEELA